MAGFATRNRFAGHPEHSTDTRHALRLETDHLIGAGHKLELEVLRAFSSKYALALYEAVARRVRLQHICSERFDLDDFRELLGVEHNKLTTYGNLNQYAIKPALLEVNALSDFLVSAQPMKSGRRVIGVMIGWSVKDIEGRKTAYTELQRSRIGRRSRMAGTVEAINAEGVLE